MESDHSHGKDSINSQQISLNFTMAKLLAILFVLAGHYFDGSILWIPSTVGLFVFAYSSGYFSANRYDQEFSWRSFWIAKIRRLFPSLLIINIFLLVLFVIQGKDNIISLHSVLAWFGMTGILGWLGIHNQSPFGNGLWFFTVLMLFYVVYPWLSKACSSRYRAHEFLAFSALGCTLAHFYISPPYMLWLTVFGFCLGVYSGRLGWAPRRNSSLAMLLGCTALLLGLNLFSVNQFNFFLISALSISSVAVLMSLPIRPSLLGPLAILMPCVLEIYFIHTYLFVKLQDALLTGFSVSLIIIFIAAFSLNKLKILIFKSGEN